MPVPVLDTRQIRSAISMSQAVDAVRDGFVAYGRGEFSTPHYWDAAEGGFVVKAVVHDASQTMAVKTLTVDAARRPLISGVLTMLDRRSGTELVADAATVTSMRTGAIVGVATDALARDDADRLTLIGAGAQAADQVRAVRAVRPISTLTVAARDLARGEALVAAMGDELAAVDVRVTDDVARAVSAADVVCCATSAVAPLFALADLPDRVHVNAIGSFRPTMRELPAELLAAATVVVDDRHAVLEESGEIIHALDAGLLQQDDLLELAAVLAVRPDARERTVFKTVGIAVQDWALMRLLSAGQPALIPA